MVEGNNTAVPRGKENTRRLGVLLGILCFLIVGLTVTNILVLVNKDKGGDEGGEGEEQTFACADYWQVTDAVHCVKDSYTVSAETMKYGEGNCTGICYEYYKTAEAFIESHGSTNSVSDIRGIYDQFILAVNDDNSAHGLKIMRDYKIAELDTSEEFNQEMLADAIEADNFFKSLSSVDTVLVMAYKLNREDLIQQYTAIKTERELAMGIDSSQGKGEG
ncbi:hypothetical protein IJS18_02115 [Candidatus Saccharibacteria bacterium]|nr:hypothetical protein [Candidatus Saccharibacteria bacterium]